MRTLSLVLTCLVACNGPSSDTDTDTDTGDTDTGEAIVQPTEPSTLAASGDRACALAPDGMRCWGGDQTVTLLTQPDADAPGHAVSGEVVCWLDASGGASCSQGDAEPSVLVASALHIAGDSEGFCAVKGDRTVGCWDRTETTETPVADAIGASRTYPHAGTTFWSLVQANGVVQTWGGGGPTTTNTVIRGGEELSHGPDHGCARTTFTAAECWGSDALGQTGVAGSGTVTDVDRVTVFAEGVVRLVGGTHHTCALLDDDSVHCWGDNSRGQLGQGTVGTPAFSATPVQVAGLPSVVGLAAGDAFTCAALEDARVLCWGAGEQGQLGAAEDAAVPTRVIGPENPS